MSAEHPAVTVLDSSTGAVLYRQPLESDATEERPAKQPANHNVGLAYRYFPKARHGGKQLGTDFTARGWLPPHATSLRGNNATTWSDVNDDNTVQKSEKVPPVAPHSWRYRLQPFHLKNVLFCDNPYPCSWNPNKPYSWKVNRNAERDAGLLLRQPVARPPGRRSDRVHRGGRQLPAGEPHSARQGR